MRMVEYYGSTIIRHSLERCQPKRCYLWLPAVQSPVNVDLAGQKPSTLEQREVYVWQLVAGADMYRFDNGNGRR